MMPFLQKNLKTGKQRESRIKKKKLQRFLARCSGHARGALDWLKSSGNIVAGVCHHSVVVVFVKRLHQATDRNGEILSQIHGASNKWSNEKDKE
jgi:hypothetical protein